MGQAFLLKKLKVDDNVIFNDDRNFDHTIDIYTSDNGSEGTIVSINRAALLSALTLQRQGDGSYESVVHATSTARMSGSGNSVDTNTVSRLRHR